MKFAHIAPKYQAQEIQWLRFSPASAAKDGVFILLYQELAKSSLFDYWFENDKLAHEWAQEFYGVAPDVWETADELAKRGIQIIDEQ